MASEARSVRDKRVLVIGAGQGMGRATARLFAEEGARIAVTDINAATAEAVAAEITEVGGDATAWTLDVGDAPSIFEVVAAVAAVAGELGGLDGGHQRLLRKSRGPRIVNIASTEALGATVHDSAYAASKAGVTGLTKRSLWTSARRGSPSTAFAPAPSTLP